MYLISLFYGKISATFKLKIHSVHPYIVADRKKIYFNPIIYLTEMCNISPGQLELLLLSDDALRTVPGEEGSPAGDVITVTH